MNTNSMYVRIFYCFQHRFIKWTQRWPLLTTVALYNILICIIPMSITIKNFDKMPYFNKISSILNETAFDKDILL